MPGALRRLTLELCTCTAQTPGAGLLVDCEPQGPACEVTSLLADAGYDLMHDLAASQLDKIRQLRGYDLVVVDCPGPLEGHHVLATVSACARTSSRLGRRTR
jgi:chromosome partitioning protein